MKAESPRAQKIIDDFNRDVNMDTVLREWTRQGLLKGNSPMELGGKKDELVKGVKVLNMNDMYVRRDKKGKVLGYTQYKGNKSRVNITKTIKFEPFQIAFLKFNAMPQAAYGNGIIRPGLKTIDYFLGS